MANAAPQISAQQSELRSRRRGAMALLASSSAAEIEEHLHSIEGLPRHEEIRAPESGLLMVRGRIGGDGAPFNFGEVTVSRAAVRLESGETGFGYVLGREHAKVGLIALCDALIQCKQHRLALEHHVFVPIRAHQEAVRRLQAERTAATKVEFFTLVRGEG
jgi:alpha-D-ribose 1-methylphosphonate 5-triphosphate synthase subunit PhnG